MHKRNVLFAGLMLTIALSDAGAQERRRAPGPDLPQAPGIPRNPKFPYAGSWAGTRTLTDHSDQLRFEFSVADSAYQVRMLFPNGGSTPWQAVRRSGGGWTWESPNSGGGTWVYQVQLAAADSMAGKLELQGGPANLDARGTIAMRRVAPAEGNRSR